MKIFDKNFTTYLIVASLNILLLNCSPSSNSKSTNQSADAMDISKLPPNQRAIETLKFDEQSTPEDQALVVDALAALGLNDDDIKINDIKFSIHTQPRYGTVDIKEAGKYLYKPLPNYNGKDDFSIKVSSEKLNIDRAVSINISITPVNDPPTIQNFFVRMSPGEVIDLKIPVQDVDNGESFKLSITGSTPGFELNVSDESRAIVQIRNTDPRAHDTSFNLELTDSEGASLKKTVSLFLGSKNEKPTALPMRLVLDEDTAVSGRLSGYDEIIRDPFVKIVRAPRNGKIISFDGSTGEFTYLPNENYFGMDDFDFVVSDHIEDSEPATTTLSISSVNDQPWIDQRERQYTDEDVMLEIKLLISDPENDKAYLNKFRDPLYGKFADGFPKVTDDGYLWIKYLSPKDYNGPDFFTVHLVDFKGGNDPKEIPFPVWVKAVDDAPRVTDLTIGAKEESTTKGKLIAFEPDGQPMSFSLKSAEPGLKIQINSDGSFVASGEKDITGKRTATFEVADTTGQVSSAKIIFDFENINDAPITKMGDYKVDEDSFVEFDILSLVSDIDSTSFTPTITKSPLKGTMELVAGSSSTYRFKPNPNYCGFDYSAEFKVSDGVLDSNISMLRFEVKCVNDPHTVKIVNNPLDFLEDQTITLELLYSDIDSYLRGTAPTINIETPLNITLKYAVRGICWWPGEYSCSVSLDITPPENFFGKIPIKITSSNLKGPEELDPRIISAELNIKSVNDSPQCRGLSKLPYDVADSLLLQYDCFDPDGGNVSYGDFKPTRLPVAWVDKSTGIFKMTNTIGAGSEYLEVPVYDSTDNISIRFGSSYVYDSNRRPDPNQSIEFIGTEDITTEFSSRNPDPDGDYLEVFSGPYWNTFPLYSFCQYASTCFDFRNQMVRARQGEVKIFRATGMPKHMCGNFTSQLSVRDPSNYLNVEVPFRVNIECVNDAPEFTQTEYRTMVRATDPTQSFNNFVFDPEKDLFNLSFQGSTLGIFVAQKLSDGNWVIKYSPSRNAASGAVDKILVNATDAKGATSSAVWIFTYY